MFRCGMQVSELRWQSMMANMVPEVIECGACWTEASAWTDMFLEEGLTNMRVAIVRS